MSFQVQRLRQIVTENANAVLRKSHTANGGAVSWKLAQHDRRRWDVYAYNSTNVGIPYWPNQFTMHPHEIPLVWDRIFPAEIVVVDPNGGSGFRNALAVMFEQGDLILRASATMMPTIVTVVEAIHHSGIEFIRPFSFNPFLSVVDALAVSSSYDALTDRDRWPDSVDTSSPQQGPSIPSNTHAISTAVAGTSTPTPPERFVPQPSWANWHFKSEREYKEWVAYWKDKRR